MAWQKNQGIVVGVDIHPDSFTAAVFEREESPVRAQRVFCSVKISEWEEFFKEHIPVGSIVVFEAGSNSFEYAERCKRLGYNSFIMESRQAGRLGKVYCKTDKEDAVKLGKLYLMGGEALEVWLPDIDTRMRREILHMYHSARKDCTRLKNRLKNFLTSHGIRLERGTRLTSIETEKMILSKYEWGESSIEILKSFFDGIRQTDEVRNKMKVLMIKELMKNREMLKLMNLCGIRVVCAFSLIAAIGDINRFKNPKKLVAYLGFSPSICNSGRKSKNLGLSYTGRKEIKADITQAAHAILRSRSKGTESLRKWAASLIMRRNKNVAIGAIGRKVIVAVWYVLKGHIPSNLSSCTKEEIKRKLTKIFGEASPVLFTTLGYKCRKDFLEEYTQILLMLPHKESEDSNAG